MFHIRVLNLIHRLRDRRQWLNNGKRILEMSCSALAHSLKGSFQDSNICAFLHFRAFSGISSSFTSFLKFLIKGSLLVFCKEVHTFMPKYVFNLFLHKFFSLDVVFRRISFAGNSENHIILIINGERMDFSTHPIGANLNLPVSQKVLLCFIP